MVRDLVETSIDMVREEKLDEVAERAEQSAEERLLDLLLPSTPVNAEGGAAAEAQRREQVQRTRDKLRAQLREGKLDQRLVEVEVRERSMPSFEIISNQGVEEMDINVKDMLSGMFGQQKKKRKMTRLRSLRLPDPGRRKPPDRHGPGHAHRRRPRRADGHSVHRRSGQNRRPRKRPRARTFPAKACSATFCPSSKAPR